MAVEALAVACFALLCLAGLLVRAVAEQFESGRGAFTRERVYRTVIWIVFGLSALIVLFLAVSVFVDAAAGGAKGEPWFDRLEEHLRLSWVLIVGVAGALLLPLAMRRADALERQTRVQERGLVTDRIIRATELLGATRERFEQIQDEGGEWRERRVAEPNIEARIGAIYTLERVAQESIHATGAEYWPIMETLCAYIRQNAPAESDPALPLIDEWNTQCRAKYPEPDIARDVSLSEAAALQSEREVWDEERLRALAGAMGRSFVLGRLGQDILFLPGPRDDVAAAVSAIRRQAQYQFSYELNNTDSSVRTIYSMALDLRETLLRGADLKGAGLQGVNLENSRIGRADLVDANLRRAVFSGADLRGAYLQRADLTGALFGGGTVLDGADLSSARLQCVRFEFSSLQRCNLTGADLTGAVLYGADFYRAIFSGNSIVGAHLSIGSVGVKGIDFSTLQKCFGDLRTAQEVEALFSLTAPSRDQMKEWGWVLDRELLDFDVAEGAWRDWRKARGFS